MHVHTHSLRSPRGAACCSADNACAMVASPSPIPRERTTLPYTPGRGASQTRAKKQEGTLRDPIPRERTTLQGARARNPARAPARHRTVATVHTGAWGLSTEPCVKITHKNGMGSNRARDEEPLGSTLGGPPGALKGPHGDSTRARAGTTGVPLPMPTRITRTHIKCCKHRRHSMLHRDQTTRADYVRPRGRTKDAEEEITHDKKNEAQ